MWEIAKTVARKLGIYHAIRYSKIYYGILNYTNPTFTKGLQADLAFYRMVLGDSLEMIFDVGANTGDKAWAFREIARKVVCFEPDQSCYLALQTRFRGDPRVFVENVALGDRIGRSKFFIKESGSGYNTLSDKERDWVETRFKSSTRESEVQVSTLDYMIAVYGAPAFLKIDVEGFEFPVLNGLTGRIPTISFEANLPRFREETLAIVARFSSSRFNLRLGNEFIFQTHRKAEEIVETLSSNQEITYDIFMFS